MYFLCVRSPGQRAASTRRAVGRREEAGLGCAAATRTPALAAAAYSGLGRRRGPERAERSAGWREEGGRAREKTEHRGTGPAEGRQRKAERRDLCREAQPPCPGLRGRSQSRALALFPSPAACRPPRGPVIRVRVFRARARPLALEGAAALTKTLCSGRTRGRSGRTPA